VPAAPLQQLGQGDEVTFGPGSNNTTWDQFAANEELFGVTTNFDEDVYTTKIDRSAADYKERERKAQKIANEIIGVISSPFEILF
jgi:PAB1-binding protein PBP1